MHYLSLGINTNFHGRPNFSYSVRPYKIIPVFRSNHLSSKEPAAPALSSKNLNYPASRSAIIFAPPSFSGEKARFSSPPSSRVHPFVRKSSSGRQLRWRRRRRRPGAHAGASLAGASRRVNSRRRCCAKTHTQLCISAACVCVCLRRGEGERGGEGEEGSGFGVFSESFRLAARYSLYDFLFSWWYRGKWSFRFLEVRYK